MLVCVLVVVVVHDRKITFRPVVRVGRLPLTLTFSFGGHDVTAGASAGVALLGPNAEVARALEEADRAMYVRKAQRRHEASGEADRSERA